MTTLPLAITATGMVTPVGLDTASSCTAIRSGINDFQETRFMDAGGEWIQGCQVPLEHPWRGNIKLVKMLAMALRECCEEASIDLGSVPVFLCVSELERPGREKDLGSRLFISAQEELKVDFHPSSTIVQHGRVGGLVALHQVRKVIYEEGLEKAVIAGVDSLLSAHALREYEKQDRILTSQNSNGFIPGEAASALLIEKPDSEIGAQLVCRGLGFGVEQATILSEEPLRAEGMVHAIRQALEESGKTMDDMDFRIVDATGEHYGFKEAALVLGRLLRHHKEGFPLWHVTDCVGELGAAVFGVSLAYAKMAYAKGFDAGGNLLIHNSNDNGRRAAGVFEFEQSF